jgi:two-component system, cell cycle sensor histidine kinase and response regulator CckA
MRHAKTHTGGTILLAEDEHSLRDLIMLILVAEGHQVLPAPDGERALQVAAAFDGAIDLLLTDVMMPELDGPTLARKLTAVRPDVRTILMSGSAPETIEIDDSWVFLTKPILTRELLRHVDAALGLHQSPRRAIA